MQIIVRPRQMGKTHAMVQWVLEGERTDSYPGWSRVILTPDIRQADYLRAQYPNLDYRQVFSWQEWRDARLGYRPVDVAVDNAEMILASIIRHTPAVVSMTGTVAE